MTLHAQKARLGDSLCSGSGLCLRTSLEILKYMQLSLPVKSREPLCDGEFSVQETAIDALYRIASLGLLLWLLPLVCWRAQVLTSRNAAGGQKLARSKCDHQVQRWASSFLGCLLGY